MTTLNTPPLPNLFALDSREPRLMAQAGSLAPSAHVARDLTQAGAPRALAPDAITHHPIQRYTEAQMAMRPVDRADAALMAVVDPAAFNTFLDAVVSEGDWRSLLAPFAQQLQQRPEWLQDEYRLPAAYLLKQSQYFLDLSVFGR